MNVLENYYNKHIIEKNIEFEIRLGKQFSNQFKNITTENNFKNLQNNFNKCQIWKKIVEENTTDVFLNGGYRKTGKTIIKKENIYKHTKKINNNYDLRFALNIEHPISVVKNNLSTENIRKKKRFSYYKDFYRFDLTIINKNIYEIEMELVDFTFARKHSFEFIVKSMSDVFNNLISSSNFKWST
jgi:hypothetical protein